MDYQKIYKNLMLRAKLENRKKTKTGTYYEKHHIIPECLFKQRKRKGPKGFVDGDPEDKDNIVLLTAREHFIAHVLLYKIYKDTIYGYRIGSALAFFFTKIIGSKHPRNTILTNSKKYEHYRSIGLSSISSSQRGWINVRDSETGEYIGRVSVNDLNYISGKYVHHTKGRKISDSERKNRKPQNGSNNSNYKELTDERKSRLFNLIEKCIVENHLIVKLLQKEITNEFKEFKSISLKWVLNNFKTYENLINEYNLVYNKNIQYNPYFRSSSQKQINSENEHNKIWITDGIETKRINKDDEIPENFKLGRTIKNVKDKKTKSRKDASI